ncbi:hypothetical protein C3F09_08505 [candidate division GN15 bacterium]|uniref:Signal transduction histidine kinase dimerisation/phosphoacceptor domain-containing protein n=1 Tax=candidate division GN15 bacterium TaxID=2072418 RepID=A0A855WYY3_9BACT|nr:MAG: hypothetical protein C3F09_08505 [candidate division GN15 bacterium]
MSNTKSEKTAAGTLDHTALAEDLALFQALKPYIGHCLSMNHEINNSLAGLIGYTEFLLMDESSLAPQQKRQVEMIAKCAERIRQVVQNLCDEKIALSERIDLRPVMETYKAIEKKLD